MSFRAIQNGPRVLVLVDGKLAADLCAETALETADALRSVAKLAQEWANAETVVNDSALFLRASGLGLAYHSAIRAEAHKRAQWDREFRKLPATPGIPSAGKVGRPSLSRSEVMSNDD